MSDFQFKSIYKDDLADYLAISEGTIGEETLSNTRRILQSFDSLLMEEDTIEISEELINRWVDALTKINSPKTVSDKVSYLRKFLRYLQYKGYSVFMPDCPKTTDNYIPYIFSEEEIQLLLACADNLAARLTNSQSRQTAIEFCMLLRMLIGCGFRRGEPLAAKVKDVNFLQGTILIRHAKNNKQRIVPMNSALADMLERYCIALGIRMELDSFLFPSSRKKGAATTGSTFSIHFRELLKETGLYIPRKEHSRGQCLHCFRHYFAIHSFAQAEKNGRPVNDSVPFLSVYLGHHDMDETEKYLKFSGDMFPEHIQMFEDYTAGVFTEVPYEEE